MNFYTKQHQFYAGIDLHARLLAVCILDQAGHIVCQTKIPADKLAGWLFTKRDFYRDPDARPDLVTLQANIDQLRKEGSLSQPLDVKKYTDLSILEEAIKRLR